MQIKQINKVNVKGIFFCDRSILLIKINWFSCHPKAEDLGIVSSQLMVSTTVLPVNWLHAEVTDPCLSAFSAQ